MAEPIGANQTREERLARIDEKIRLEREAYLTAYWKQRNPDAELDQDAAAIVREANALFRDEANLHYAEVDRLLILRHEVACGVVFAAAEHPRPSHL